MFLVTGITGHVGGATAEALLAQGQKVRALVRNPEKAAQWKDKEVQLFPADLTDSNAVAAALQGVDGAYIMLPPTMAPQPGFPEAKAIIASYVEALRRSPPPRLVVLSSIGSEKSSGLGLITSTHLLEEALAQFSFPIAFIRAGGFIENYLGVLQPAAQTGIMYTFFQPVDRSFSVIATKDIGAEAARLLTTKWTGKRIIELGSPRTPNDIAAAMSNALGRPVTAQAIPRDRWAATVESFGMPPGSSGPYEEMIDSSNSGWITFGIPGTESVAGTTRPEDVFAAALKQNS